VHDAVEADRGVTEAGAREDDEQVEAGQRLGLQQVAEEWHVESGELKPQCPRHGPQQGRVGQRAWASPGAEGDGELRGA
jgi:hypothetical protein